MYENAESSVEDFFTHFNNLFSLTRNVKGNQDTVRWLAQGDCGANEPLVLVTWRGDADVRAHVIFPIGCCAVPQIKRERLKVLLVMGVHGGALGHGERCADGCGVHLKVLILCHQVSENNQWICYNFYM